MVVLTRISLISAPDEGVIDSPVTFGLSTVVNQLKVDPTFADRTAFTDAPLQISMVCGMDKITSGITVTVNDESGPKQPSGVDTGVTTYVTFCGDNVVFVNVLFTVEEDCITVTSPVTVAVGCADHVKFDGMSLVRFTVKSSLLQMVTGGIFSTCGVGFTVIVNDSVLPGHVTPEPVY